MLVGCKQTPQQEAGCDFSKAAPESQSLLSLSAGPVQPCSRNDEFSSKNIEILRGEKNVPLRGHFVARKKAFKLYGVGQEEGGRGGVDFGAFG